MAEPIAMHTSPTLVRPSLLPVPVPCGFRAAAESAKGRAAGTHVDNWCRGALGLSAVAVVVHEACHRHRRTRACRRAYGSAAGSQGKPVALKEADENPKNLYELLGISPDADQPVVKKAYYQMQKLVHPDVAGPEGEKLSMLVNDAYEMLRDPRKRSEYDAQLVVQKKKKKPKVTISTDFRPTWAWKPKRNTKEPEWDGEPRSRSRWDKVPLEGRGEKHQQQMFMYVDEFQCISCRNCCDVAPRTFCIDADTGRARAYTQWGDDEEYIDYAMASCPVDCIHWVGRKELASLEHVTAKRMFDSNYQEPCPMLARQGVGFGGIADPWSLAQKWQEYCEAEFRSQQGKVNIKVLDRMATRIDEAFSSVSKALRDALANQKYNEL